MAETVRLPLFGTYSTRLGDTSKDQRFKNCFLELVKAPRVNVGQSGVVEGVGEHKFYVVKRPGFSDSIDTTHTAAGRGIYTWKGNKYSVIGDRIYKESSEITSAGSRLNNTTGRVYFTEEHKTDLLIIQDGDDIWTINASDTITEQTDADIPSNQVPGIVHMDTYIFVMNSDGEIYNSDVDDVTSWTSSNFITSKIEPDDGVALTKWQNYVVAFGEWSMEFFYDAENASGSPLSIAQGTTTDTGCAAGDTVWSDEDIIIWVGQTRRGGKKVVAFSGSEPLELSTPPITRILEQEETNLDTAFAYGFRFGGHLWYVLTLDTTQQITLVCDVENRLWYEWTSDDGATETYFTGVDYTHDDGKHFLLDEDNGKIYELDFDIYQDSGNDINFELVTNKIDFGTTANKFLHRLTLIGDEQTSSSTVTLDWTDDDYQNYSSNTRSLDMSEMYPTAYHMGAFRSRAFRFKHTANTPLRVEALELVYSGGHFQGGNI